MANDYGKENSVMNTLLSIGTKEGFLSRPSFVFVPEVMMLAPRICPRVHEMVTRVVVSPTASCGFCAYAAIGATYLWQNDFERFQKEDVLDVLTKPRGEDYMDEYITDLTGFDHEKIQSHLQMAAVITIGQTKDAANHFEQCLETMFHYGMVLEMNKLGL